MYVCMAVLMHMCDYFVIVMFILSPSPHTQHIHPHDSQFLPPLQLFTRAKAEWVFFRSAIIPSAECRQWNYSVGTPCTPIPHSLHTPISMGNKAKPFRQIWNKHIQTFCLLHLGTTNGFSSYCRSRLKIYAYLYPRLSFSKFRQAWSGLAFAHVAFAKLISLLHTTDMMWCHLITHHISPGVGVLKRRTNPMHISSAPPSL